jgi:hypothetical protein
MGYTQTAFLTQDSLQAQVPHFSKGRAVILCMPSIANRMKMICAALQAPQPLARTSTRTPTRTSTRTSFSQGRPLHQKWRPHHFVSCAHHFAWARTPFFPLRKPFCLEAHIILLVVLRRQHRHLGACRRGRVTGSQEAGWCAPGRHGGLSPWSQHGLAESTLHGDNCTWSAAAKKPHRSEHPPRRPRPGRGVAARAAADHGQEKRLPARSGWGRDSFQD